MRPTDLLLLQIGISILGLWWHRQRLRGSWSILVRLLLFMAAASYSFDYMANDRSIWIVNPGWEFTVLLNPFENIIFSVVMTTHLVLLDLSVESYIAKRSH